MAAWKPKEIRRWKTKQQQSSSSIHKLIRFVLFLPLFYLLLERAFLFPFEDSSISSYLDVEHVAVTTTIKKKDVKSTPVAALRSPIFETPWRRRKSLESLTQPFLVTDASSSQCPDETETLIAGYRHLGKIDSAEKETNIKKQKIPKLLHQQGSSRCVSAALYDLNESWAKELDEDNEDGREWSMFFHTEDALTRLFRAVLAVGGDEQRSPLSRIGREFPHLGQILRNCVDISTFPRKILWRFLCLYAFGGMYVDLGYSSTSPQTYDDVAKTVLRDSYNTALLWTTAGGYPEALSRSGVQINPFIIAVSPGHPLMYYAAQHVLMEIVTDGFLGENFEEQFAQNKIVSEIVERAIADFHDDRTLGTAEQQPDGLSSGESAKVKTYHGSGDTRVIILGELEEGFSDASELVSGKALSLESQIQKSLRKQSRLKSSTCLFKSLAEVSIVA